HEIGVLGGLGRGGRGGAAVLPGPGLGLGAVAVVDGEVVAALLADVPGHGIAHDAQPNPSHLRPIACHVASPLEWPDLVPLLTKDAAVVRSGAPGSDPSRRTSWFCCAGLCE